jgi:hypothetical protein
MVDVAPTVQAERPVARGTRKRAAAVVEPVATAPAKAAAPPPARKNGPRSERRRGAA